MNQNQRDSLPDVIEGPPNRVCAHDTSPFYDERFRLIAVKFRGQPHDDVVEYCVSGRWIKAVVKGKDGKIKFGNRGKIKTVKKRGDVEVSWRSMDRPCS